MNDELKPCPFCGSTHLEIVKLHGWYYVICNNDDCKAEGPIDLGESRAIEKWNERAEK